MKYKAGDEVLIKAEITDVNRYECGERPYFVAPDKYSVNWVSEDKIIPMDKTYADGLKDAWELARKIALPYGGNEFMIDSMFSASELEFIFGSRCYDKVLSKYTAEEALAKIEAYEKQKEIKVGDVVEDEEETKALVVEESTKDHVFVLTEKGSSEEWYKRGLKKTGKHIDIELLLKQIGE